MLFRWAMFALLSACSRSSSEPEAPAPDVLLVVLDTTRVDHLSAYGYARDTSPQLSLLAESGVIFEDATASGSWTYPNHASLFTGEPPWVHRGHWGAYTTGLLVKGYGMGVQPMRRDLPTLAEKFSAAGYQTSAFSGNAYLLPVFLLSRGFSRVECDEDIAVVTGAIEEIQKKRDQPLFLFVNLNSAHTPWHVTPSSWSRPHAETLNSPGWHTPYLDADGAINLDLRPEPNGLSGLERYHTGDLAIDESGHALITDLYDGQINATDYLLMKLVTAWKERSPDGIVAVVSDHGELLGERGLMGHGRTVYPEVTRVAVVLNAPGRLQPARRSEAVQLRDVHPTLLELAGLPGDHAGSLLRPQTARPIQSVTFPSVRWARDLGGRFKDEWRLYRKGADAVVLGSRGQRELYDLQHDPWMRTDLAAEHPGRADALAAEAEAAFPMSARPPSENIEPPDEAMERLRQLGYIE